MKPVKKTLKTEISVKTRQMFGSFVTCLTYSW